MLFDLSGYCFEHFLHTFRENNVEGKCIMVGDDFPFYISEKKTCYSILNFLLKCKIIKKYFRVVF